MDAIDEMTMENNEDWNPELDEFMAEQLGEPSERDVWMAANQLVKRTPPCSLPCGLMIGAKGDMAQYWLSKRILTAIDELLTMAPPPGTRVS